MSSLFQRVYKVIGLGEFGSNSHPIHPATIHFPIAFLSLANTLNLLYGITAYAPALSPLTADKENLGTIALASYFLNVVGILSSIPAVSTGFAELYAMVNARGLYITDAKTGEQKLEPVVKVTLLHAGLNDVAIVGAVYNWFAGRGRAGEAYAPLGHQVLISLGALSMTMFAAYLGGSLVYKHGVGVQRMGDGLEEKKKKKGD